MSYSVITIKTFERQAKRLLKKYPSLKSELAILIAELKNDPKKGIHLGKNCFKIRISIASKGKGKSGGARVITHFIIQQETVYLLSIYDKSEEETVSNDEINQLLQEIEGEQ